MSPIPPLEDLNPDSFREAFRKIVEMKRKAGLIPILDNPPDLFERAKLYGNQYRNGAWGWASNIWSRSAANTSVVDDDGELKYEHKLLMLRVLEHILAQGPLIKVDGYVGKPGTKVQMHARVYVDPQFPDIAYRWSQLVFPAPPDGDPDAELFVIPHYLGNPKIPGTENMMMVIRFPYANLTIVTVSSYQGEVKKGVLCHWINFVYGKGCTGEHAALREFTVKMGDGSWRRVVMAIWGLTGSGKSTHSFYAWDERNSRIFIERFGINPLEFVKDQVIKNDDIIAICDERVYGSERGAWTKTEDLDETQTAMWRGAMSSRALHENTEFDERGMPSFKGELFTYFGKPNRNSRTVLYLEDTGFFDDVVSSGPLTTAIFLSPSYFTSYAWMRVRDPAIAAKFLADGKTIGHPAQAKELVGKVRYVPRFSEFTIGVSDSMHVLRFYEMLRRRDVEVYVFVTTGRVGAEYKWVEREIKGVKISVPEPIFEESDGRIRVRGGSKPTIEEDELFILQSSRGVVEYEPHPFWGDKVLVPRKVPGLSDSRLKELKPTSYYSMKEFEELLRAEIEESKIWLRFNCPELPDEIVNSMDF
ncbi:phosphoenolpyruvate carboxykinase (ATP) [Candidatus Korarchaeum cryptofilum]|uniref:Phosphoenolpyruvate carboxykinase (ATP) n=1 Tax=Korarchaeum cryptofilum (strain OPF8) TaxID=374847 RepID=B1L3P6_KORCO|nr:phosphoenolpyruvate carboxykinase (ATP) [Candidatus Korarchaeum cryptofilum]ACB07075.1 Phosphoenolpyruvate carboxykinase (ATP) [Candidatus Korarchaeum cryptofilum OPF8]